ncbi:hypothetical protein ACFQL1_19995 [Halomicroarcula sp. GCM10025709]|nr:hypothetical protein [Halomicroarcula sp. YJ-61-S]
MLGLRYFACQACDTAHAVPEELAVCGRCGSSQVEEITDQLSAAPYFSP